MISKPYTPEPFRARRDDVIRARMRLAHASSAMNASDERDELLGDARSHDRAPSWAWKVAIGVACALAVMHGVGASLPASSASTSMTSERSTSRAAIGKSFKCEVIFKPEFAGFRICNSQWSNAGDLLGEPIVREMLERRFECDAYAFITHRTKSKGSNCLWSVGSVMQFVHSGDVVWGLGVWHAEEYAAGRLGTPLDFEVRGVRGPETAHLLDKVHGTIVPSIGDPGILVSEFFPEIKATAEHKCLIRHVSGDKTVAPEGVKSFTPGDFGSNWRLFVEEVARCSHVYSSSLHGLIVADSFGIPARWFFPEDQEVVAAQSDFKYRDWLEMSGRSEEFLRPRHNIDSMLDESSYAPPLSQEKRREIINKLVTSFPFDMFTTVEVGSED